VTSVGRHNAMLTPRDVASLLSIDINTVRRWTNQGLLKAYRIGPRGDRRFRKEDIDLFLNEKRQIDTNNEDSVG
jgi:excisionase family DNA binding protein